MVVVRGTCYLCAVAAAVKLHVVIPVYNEQPTLLELVRRVREVKPPRGVSRRLVIIDDGSSDGTASIVRSLGERPDVLVVLHERNRGKGAAVRSGFKAALDDGADIVLIQDGDLEYSPEDHAAMLAPILDGRADVVIGTRFKGRTHRVLYYWHSVANTGITQLSNMLTNLNLSDIECCFKAFTREVAQHIEIREDRFGVEPELIAKVARMRLESEGGFRLVRIFETPISYAGRTYAEGKKIGWRDGVWAVWCIVRYNLLR